MHTRRGDLVTVEDRVHPMRGERERLASDDAGRAGAAVEERILFERTLGDDRQCPDGVTVVVHPNARAGGPVDEPRGP